MSITLEPTGTAPNCSRQLTAAPPMGLAAALEAMARGMRAAVEWERLSQMTDGQLAARGLAREGLAEEIFERHFADLR